MAAGLAAMEGLLPSGWEQRELKGFQPRARYFDAMDDIVYLQEDLPYRADRVDEFLTLLWHPYEQRAIGVKLKGIRALFNNLRAILSPLGVDLTDKDFIPVVSLLEFIMSVKTGASITADTEKLRLDDRYEVARKLLSNEGVDTRELASVRA